MRQTGLVGDVGKLSEDENEDAVNDDEGPSLGGASRTRQAVPPVSSPPQANSMPNAGSCSFVLKCDASHLQIAHPSLTLVPRFLSPWMKGLCDSALRVEVLRARPRAPPRGLSARDQFADR